MSDTTEQKTLETITEENVTEQPQPQALLAGKYKDVEALEKGYKELTKLLRERPKTEETDVPEQYDFSFLEGMDAPFEPSDPLLGRMEPLMKEHGLNQAQAEALVRGFVETTHAHCAAQHEDSESLCQKERDALGPEAQNVLSTVELFVNNNFSAEEAEAINTFATSANRVKLLHKLATMHGEKGIPKSAGENTATAAELRTKAKTFWEDPTLRKDPSKQKEYNRLWSEITRLEDIAVSHNM